MQFILSRKPITFQSIDFKIAWNLYQSTFPEEEKREAAAQKKIIEEEKNYHCEGIFLANKFVGFLFWWSFERLRFVEHFATLPHYRNKGLGKKVMEDFINESTKPIVLEIELPNDVDKERRMLFYQRLGFHINNVEYQQPPYKHNDSFTPLLLLSYPKQLTPDLISYFLKEPLTVIYREYFENSFLAQS